LPAVPRRVGPLGPQPDASAAGAAARSAVALIKYGLTLQLNTGQTRDKESPFDRARRRFGCGLSRPSAYKVVSRLGLNCCKAARARFARRPGAAQCS
jgi:hypothetical protein